MFTDIVGFTARTSAQSRAENEQMLREHDRVLHPVVANFGGTRIKAIGDAMLISFRSPTEAVHCAMAMHDALFDFNRERDERDGLHIRVALNVGDVRVEEGDIFGEAVNIAARLEGMTPADEIYFSEAVWLAMNRAEVEAEEVGTRDLKGIPHPVRVFRVKSLRLPNDYPFGGVHEDSSNASRALRRLGFVGHAGKRHDKRFVWTVFSVGLVLGLGAAIGVTVLGGDESPVEASGSSPRVQAPARPPLGPDHAKSVPKSERNFIAEAERFLAQGRLNAAEQTYRDALAADPGSVAAILLEGHLAFERKQRSKGIKAYERAVERQPLLKENERLTRNVVDSLGYQTRDAKAFLLAAPSEVATAALLRRVSQSGYWGRYHAKDLLTKLDAVSKIPAFAVARLDLKEADTCRRRLGAVKQFGALGDPRAVKILEPYVEVDLFGRSKTGNDCLVEPTRAVLGKLTGRPGKKKKVELDELKRPELKMAPKPSPLRSTPTDDGHPNLDTW